MIETPQDLVGFRLEAFRISKGSYTLEFDGELDGKKLSLLVSSNHNLAASNTAEDLGAQASVFLWPLLETNLASVEVSESDTRREIKLVFPTSSISFWARQQTPGELLMVEERLGQDWRVFL